MKRLLICLLLLLLLVVADAQCECMLTLDDIDVQVLSANTALTDSFTVKANDRSQVQIDSTVSKKIDNEVFYKKLNLKGGGSLMERSVNFPVKRGETVKIYGNSSSQSESRILVVACDNKVVRQIEFNSLPGGVTVAVFKANQEGTYTIYSKRGGMYLYKVVVEK